MSPKESEDFWETWCREELLQGRQVRIHSKGYSMLPSIFPGAALQLAHKGFTDVKIGEVIAFKYKGNLVAHRVVGAKMVNGEFVLQTQGDSNWQEDKTIGSEQFIGVIRGKVSAKGLERIRNHSQLTLIFVRILLGIFRLAMRIRSKTKQIIKPSAPSN